MDAYSKFFLVLLSALSGVGLFFSDFPYHLWWLQAVALLPWLFGLALFCNSKRAAAMAGLVLGACFLVPLSICIDLPLPMAIGLGLYMVLLWMVMSIGAYIALNWSAVLGALATGAVAVMVEWVDFTLVPMWGTAQAFVRVWSASPWAAQVASLGGMLALIFLLVAGQALLVRVLTFYRGWPLCLVMLLLLLGGAYLWNTHSWQQTGKGTLRVATMGWTWDHLPGKDRKAVQAILEKIYEPMLIEAAKKGARLVVSPEVGFWLTTELKPDLISSLEFLAKEHKVNLAVGYFDVEADKNRLLYIDHYGNYKGSTSKRHLIRGMEDYEPGPGTPVVIRMEERPVVLVQEKEVPAPDKNRTKQQPVAKAKTQLAAAPKRIRIGGMICQDDNFTDLSLAYGRLFVKVMVVPTNDWIKVKDYHLENSIFRAIENRYGIIRAASNGISAIISPRGEVLARMDHFEQGPGVLVADLPLPPRNRTLYTRGGSWVTPLAAVVLWIFAWGMNLRRLQREARQ